MASADIDNDSDYDLFAGTFYAGGITYFQNTGTPQYPQFMEITSNWQEIYINEGIGDPCFNDLDSDGDLDLLIGAGEGTLYYYRNDGDSASAHMTLVSDNYLGLDAGDYASPELADIDGDGDLDLFVGRSVSSAFYFQQGDVFFLENTGTPQSPNFQLVTTNYLVFDAGDGVKPLLLDIDADGDPDLFTCKGNNLLFYHNTGAVNAPRFVYESENFGVININTIRPWFVDLDNDGDYDLLAGEGAIPGPPGLYLYNNRGTPQNPQFTLTTDNLVPGVFTQSSVVLSPATADIDADGDQDLLVSDDNGYFYFFQNVGSPSHFQLQYITNDWQNIDDGMGAHRMFCFYDIDNDMDLDL